MLFVLTAMVAWSRALPGCHFGLFQGNRNIVAEPAPFSRLERDCLHHYRRGGRPCPLIGNRGTGTGRRREKWRGEDNMVRDNAQIPPMFDDSTIFVCRNENWKATPVDLPIRRQQLPPPNDFSGCCSPSLLCPRSPIPAFPYSIRAGNLGDDFVFFSLYYG